MSVSILIPTRNRLDLLKKSIESIIQNCDKNFDFDILVRMDFDEIHNADDLRIWANKLDYNQKVKIFVGYRFRYVKMHLYYTELSFVSEKKWLWLWNDEVLMQQNQWDETIKPHLNTFQLLFPNTDSCFHLCPKKLVEILGYYAPTTHCDSWQGKLASDLGIAKFFDLKLMHDRYDLTGNNLDETFLDRNYINNNQAEISRNNKELELVKSYLLKNGTKL
jgi:hypothetical protein